MSKFIKYDIRPAGDSDEYNSDSDDFSFPDDDAEIEGKYKYSNYSYDDNKPNNEDFSVVDKENAITAKRNLEFDVLKACMSGHIEVVNNYIKDGNDVNEFLHTEWTLLLYAASAIQPEIVKLLLDFGADPNKHKDGYTPLMALCSSLKENITEKAVECLDILIQAKADPNATNKNRENALMLSVKLRSQDFIKHLIKQTHDLFLTDSDGNNVLHYAVIYNRVEIVKLLLNYNIDLTVKNNRGSTAYDLAVVKQYAEITKVLAPNLDDNVKHCEVMNITKWEELFPDVCKTDDDKVLYDISLILYGMGLERYKSLFKGMTLKTFLNLNEDDLESLGMDLSIHRKRFIEELYRFHNHQWNPRSLGFQKRKSAYRIFDGVLALGNIVKKFNVIGSSFNYIRRSITNTETNSLLLMPKQKKEYVLEIEKTQKTMTTLKKELQLFKKLAKKFSVENRNFYPATYISKKKLNINWPVIMTITVILGLCLSKTHYVQKLLPIEQ